MNLKTSSYIFQCVDGGVFRRRLKTEQNEMERNVVQLREPEDV